MKVGGQNRWREDHLTTYFEALQAAASTAVVAA
jgi:hypothetical protein